MFLGCSSRADIEPRRNLNASKETKFQESYLKFNFTRSVNEKSQCVIYLSSTKESMQPMKLKQHFESRFSAWKINRKTS